MATHQDVRAESVLYWSAISMIVCEGYPVSKAARRLGVSSEQLQGILEQRQALQLDYLATPITRPLQEGPER